LKEAATAPATPQPRMVRPAYVAQARWLALFGKSLGGEFSIDPMTLLVRTTCTM
jgi:hypothetical protein